MSRALKTCLIAYMCAFALSMGRSKKAYVSQIVLSEGANLLKHCLHLHISLQKRTVIRILLKFIALSHTKRTSWSMCLETWHNDVFISFQYHFSMKLKECHIVIWRRNSFWGFLHAFWQAMCESSAESNLFLIVDNLLDQFLLPHLLSTNSWSQHQERKKLFS